jgi:hypothetical protein
VCEQRERKLNMVMTVLVTIAMNLYARISMGAVLTKLAKGLRYIWPDPEYPVAKASAFSYRRYQLGPRPLVNLFHRVCRPMANAATPGAFLFGLRLMAIDGTVEDVPDTPENVAAFGRHPGDRGDSAFAQIQAVYLAERGTITNREFRELCPELSDETIRRELSDMVDQGLIMKVGDRKATYYILK